MSRTTTLTRPPDRLAVFAATAAAAAALVLSFVGPDGAGGVRVLLLLAAGLLTAWYVRRLHRLEQRAALGWRAALVRQAALEQQLAAYSSLGEDSGAWMAAGAGVATAARTAAGTDVDALPMMVWASRADGTPTRVNRRWTEYTGRPAPESPADIDALVHPADRPRVRRAWQRATDFDRPYRAELRLRGADGGYRWFLAQAEPTAAGEWVGTTTDIHRVRRAGRAERRKRAGYRLAADAAAGIVYDWDPRTGRVTRHRGLAEVLGYRPDEVPPTAAGWAALVHPDDRPRVTAAGSALTPAADRLETRYRVRHKDGSWRHLQDRAILFWEGGRLARVIGCSQDVTPEVEAGAELRAADRRKDDLLAQIAHELRNPLAPIRTAVEAVRAVPGLPPVAAGAADIIARQTRHLGRLVDDLMDVTRIARGKVRLNPARCDLREVVGDAVEMCRPAVDARRHALTVDLPAGPLAVHADAGRLVQVVANLLTNAAKYTPDGGRIRVTAAAENGRAVVRVADTGLGLAADQLGRVFEPFAQLDSGRDRAAGGLGIGLALVRSLVELHGGTVAAASPGPGRGSVFTVTLPPAGGAVGPCGPTPAARGGLSVLVVDDHPDAADSLAGLLRLLGHRAAVAHDGPTGLAKARELRPDLVLLDLGLPGLSGAAVAEAVRADKALAGVRLVAVSGRDGVEGGSAFDDHLTKPVGPTELQRALGAAAVPVAG